MDDLEVVLELDPPSKNSVGCTHSTFSLAQSAHPAPPFPRHQSSPLLEQSAGLCLANTLEKVRLIEDARFSQWCAVGATAGFVWLLKADSGP